MKQTAKRNTVFSLSAEKNAVSFSAVLLFLRVCVRACVHACVCMSARVYALTPPSRSHLVWVSLCRMEDGAVCVPWSMS